MNTEVERKNRKTLRVLLLLVLVMFLFAAALIPLYDVLCEITGINGKTKRDASVLSYVIDTQRELTLEFITSVSAGTQLHFKVDDYELKVHPGEVVNMRYTVTNTTAKRIVAKANPSVTPGTAVGYFKNTECFCFEPQIFNAGETKHLTVQVIVDPALPKQYKRLTFSLTFFDMTNNK